VVEEMSPFTNPHKPGRKDRGGVEWWACDPYPTWFRYENEKVVVPGDGFPGWADEPEPQNGDDSTWPVVLETGAYRKLLRLRGQLARDVLSMAYADANISDAQWLADERIGRACWVLGTTPEAAREMDWTPEDA
jgi:hypothetical protein